MSISLPAVCFRQPSRISLASIAAAVLLLTFVADVLLPAGVAVCVLYLSVVLPCIWLERYPRATHVALAATGLIVVGAIASRCAPGMPAWVDVVNRGTSVLILWTTAGLCELHRRVGSQLGDARAAAHEQAALARLGQMAALVAHEVRAPLAGIRAAIELIQRHVPLGTPEHELPDEIIVRIDALNVLAQELLEFAGTRPLQLARVPLREVIDHVMHLARQDPGCRNVQVSASGDAPEIAADADQLQLLIANLVQNGVHAVQRGPGTVSVDVQVSGGVCELRVRDTGTGISPEIRDRMFDAFVSARRNGTGLGLAVVQRVVERHAGSVVIEQTGQGGTTMLVRLPVSGPQSHS